MRPPEMNDNPNQIADDLIQQHGADGALDTVREGIATAHANGDNYRLSVWREVRRSTDKNLWLVEAHVERDVG